MNDEIFSCFDQDIEMKKHVGDFLIENTNMY